MNEINFRVKYKHRSGIFPEEWIQGIILCDEEGGFQDRFQSLHYLNLIGFIFSGGGGGALSPGSRSRYMHDPIIKLCGTSLEVKDSGGPLRLVLLVKRVLK